MHEGAGLKPKVLVLVGAGHAHAQVLLGLIQAPWLAAGQRVVVVSPAAQAPYSGMVPGWLMGRFTYDDICIDFESLCQRAGAEFRQAELASLQPDQSTLVLSTGETLSYDILSLNVGSTLRPPPAERQQTVLSLRPLSALRVGWEQLCQQVQAQGRPPSQLVAVGAGAAGFESIIAAAHALGAKNPLLVGRGGLLPGHSPLVRWIAHRALQKAGVALKVGERFGPADAADDAVILWATGAQAHAWQLDAAARGSLAVDADGFVRVGPGLQSVSHSNIYAVGDCASLADPRPKAGVFAVRQGPVLSAILRKRMGDKAAPLEPSPPEPPRPEPLYQDRPTALALLLSSPESAILSYGPVGLGGRWALRLKDQIDQGFVRRFAPPMGSSLDSSLALPNKKKEV